MQRTASQTQKDASLKTSAFITLFVSKNTLSLKTPTIKQINNGAFGSKKGQDGKKTREEATRGGAHIPPTSHTWKAEAGVVM